MMETKKTSQTQTQRKLPKQPSLLLKSVSASSSASLVPKTVVKEPGQRLVAARKVSLIQTDIYQKSLLKYFTQLSRLSRPVTTLEAANPLIEHIGRATIKHTAQIHKPVVYIPVEKEGIATTTLFSHHNPSPSAVVQNEKESINTEGTASSLSCSKYLQLLDMCFWLPHRKPWLRAKADAFTVGLWREHIHAQSLPAADDTTMSDREKCPRSEATSELEAQTSTCSLCTELSATKTQTSDRAPSPGSLTGTDTDTASLLTVCMHVAPSCEMIQQRLFGSWVHDAEIEGVDSGVMEVGVDVDVDSETIREEVESRKMATSTISVDPSSDMATTFTRKAWMGDTAEPLLKLFVARVRTHAQTLLRGAEESECVSDQVREGDSDEVRALKNKLHSLRRHAVLTCARKAQVDVHIDRMHAYNEAKDIAQALLGELSKVRGCPVRDIYEEYGLDLED